MTRILLFISAMTLATAATPAMRGNALHVGVQREGGLYHLSASFDTTLSECAAWRYLTDYAAATKLPGVVSSSAQRESANKVKVDRIAEERILFFHVRLHSVLEYTEFPTSKLAFSQLAGDSRSFRGEWLIQPVEQGSTLRFSGTWEPDPLLPLFIIDHFAEHDLGQRFGEMAKLAEELKPLHSAACDRHPPS